MQDLGNFVIPLSEVTDAKVAGSKAYHLARVLNKVDLIVPTTYILTTDAFIEFLRANRLEREYKKLFEYLAEEKYNDALELAKVLRKKIIDGKIPSHIKKEVYTTIVKIPRPLAIRSSATLEDTWNKSFAGVFRSHLRIYGQVDKYIKSVYVSMVEPSFLNYVRESPISELPKMAVIFQEYVTAPKYGTLFAFDNHFVIEAIINDPTGVTSGSKQPDLYLINSDGEIIKYPKTYGETLLFEFELQNLVFLSKRISKVLFPHDIEWALLYDSTPVLLQARPITARLVLPKRTDKMKIFGIPASPGKICGQVVLLRDEKSLEEISNGKNRILVAEEIELEKVQLIKKFGGVVLEIAGLTSHVAVLAREWKIPCIVGADKITKIVKDGEKVCIDGSTGEITFLERKGLSTTSAVPPTRHILFVAPHELRGIRIGRHFYLLSEMNDKIVLFNGEVEREELERTVKQLSTAYRKPVIDGGVDYWYAYALIFELSQKYEELLATLMEMYSYAENTELIDYFWDFAENCAQRAKKFAEKAEKYYSKYTQHKMLEALLNAIEFVNVAFAYWKLVNIVLFKEFTRYLAMSAPSKETLKIIRTINEKRVFSALRKELVDLITDIYGGIEKLGINYHRYTSVFALLESIKARSKRG